VDLDFVTAGFAAAGRAAAGAAGLAAASLVAAGPSFVAVVAGRVGFCLVAALADDLVATGRAAGFEAGLVIFRLTVLAVLPVFFAAALGRAGAFALETIGFDPLYAARSAL
jgi:hypothetical protein